jgi:hypothetical protein
MNKQIKKLTNLSGGYLALNLDNLIILKPRNAVTDPKTVVTSIINYSLFFIGAIALVFVIYGGIMYITSGGDSEKTTKARNTLLYAILGIIIVAISLVIVSWAGTAPVVTP